MKLLLILLSLSHKVSWVKTMFFSIIFAWKHILKEYTRIINSFVQDCRDPVRDRFFVYTLVLTTSMILTKNNLLYSLSWVSLYSTPYSWKSIRNSTVGNRYGSSEYSISDRDCVDIVRIMEVWECWPDIIWLEDRSMMNLPFHTYTSLHRYQWAGALVGTPSLVLDIPGQSSQVRTVSLFGYKTERVPEVLNLAPLQSSTKCH